MPVSLAAGQLAYSINGGVAWQLTPVFNNLPPDTYQMAVQVFGVPCTMLGPFSVTLPATPHTWYKDIDSDGYSDGQSQQTCTPPAGWHLAEDLIATSGDCNDANPAIHPAAPELCNGLDDNCNGAVESATTTWTGTGNSNLRSNPANWSDGIVPLSCQHVMIPAGHTVVVPAAFHAVRKTLDIPLSAQLTVTLTGTVDIKN